MILRKAPKPQVPSLDEMIRRRDQQSNEMLSGVVNFYINNSEAFSEVFETLTIEELKSVRESIMQNVDGINPELATLIIDAADQVRRAKQMAALRTREAIRNGEYSNVTELPTGPSRRRRAKAQKSKAANKAKKAKRA